MKYLFTMSILLWAYSLLADPILPAIYSDNAVIQQGLPIKVWGWAEPDEAITVDFKGKQLNTVTDDKGNWNVTFPAGKADGKSSMNADVFIIFISSISLLGAITIKLGKLEIKVISNDPA